MALGRRREEDDRLPPHVVDDLLRLSGLHLGVHQRNRVLSGLEDRVSSGLEDDGPGRLEPEGPLFCFLGALVPTVLQRFQGVAGSLLWYYELMLPPAELKLFLEALEREAVAWLEARAVRWEEVPKGREAEYVLVELSGLGGVPAPAAWAAERARWAELLCATVGGDLAVRIGNVDLAAMVLQREAMDAAYERYQAEGKPGGRVYPYIADRYGVRSANTITRWRKGPALEDDAGGGPVNGGFAGAAAVQVMAILAAHRPGLMSKTRLLGEMRERCHGPMANPDIVDMALRQLLREDRVQWTRRGRGEDGTDRGLPVLHKMSICIQ